MIWKLFYNLLLLFVEGEYGMNDYGLNPKGQGNEDIEEMINEIGTPEEE